MSPTGESVREAIDDCLDRIALQAARREVDDVVTSSDVLAALVRETGITWDMAESGAYDRKLRAALVAILDAAQIPRSETE